MTGGATVETAPPEGRLLAEVPFAPGDAALGDAARAALTALLDELRDQKEPYRLELETDGDSPLGQQRAQAVAAYLVENEVSGAAPLQILRLPLPAPAAPTAC